MTHIRTLLLTIVAIALLSCETPTSKTDQVRNEYSNILTENLWHIDVLDTIEINCINCEYGGVGRSIILFNDSLTFTENENNTLQFKTVNDYTTEAMFVNANNEKVTIHLADHTKKTEFPGGAVNEAKFTHEDADITNAEEGFAWKTKVEITQTDAAGNIFKGEGTITNKVRLEN